MKIFLATVIIFVVIVGASLLLRSRQNIATKPLTETKSMTLQLQSRAFAEGESIPSEYTCDGANTQPAFEISGVPSGTQSLALIMDDPDIPKSVKVSRGIEKFDHWIIFNIPPTTTKIDKGTAPTGVQGANSSGNNSYTGPCPPDKEHRYFFKLYALDITLDLPEGSTKSEVEEAMVGHILDNAELIGRYERK